MGRIKTIFIIFSIFYFSCSHPKEETDQGIVQEQTIPEVAENNIDDSYLIKERKNLFPTMLGNYQLDTNFIYSTKPFGKDSLNNLSVLYRNKTQQAGISLFDISAISNSQDVFERSLNVYKAYAQKENQKTVYKELKTKNWTGGYLLFTLKKEKNILLKHKSQLLLVMDLKSEIEDTEIRAFLDKLDESKLSEILKNQPLPNVR